MPGTEEINLAPMNPSVSPNHLVPESTSKSTPWSRRRIWDGCIYDYTLSANPPLRPPQLLRRPQLQLHPHRPQVLAVLQQHQRPAQALLALPPRQHHQLHQHQHPALAPPALQQARPAQHRRRPHPVQALVLPRQLRQLRLLQRLRRPPALVPPLQRQQRRPPAPVPVQHQLAQVLLQPHPPLRPVQQLQPQLLALHQLRPHQHPAQVPAQRQLVQVLLQLHPPLRPVQQLQPQLLALHQLRPRQHPAQVPVRRQPVQVLPQPRPLHHPVLPVLRQVPARHRLHQPQHPAAALALRQLVRLQLPAQAAAVAPRRPVQLRHQHPPVRLLRRAQAVALVRHRPRQLLLRQRPRPVQVPARHQAAQPLPQLHPLPHPARPLPHQLQVQHQLHQHQQPAQVPHQHRPARLLRRAPAVAPAPHRPVPLRQRPHPHHHRPLRQHRRHQPHRQHRAQVLRQPQPLVILPTQLDVLPDTAQPLWNTFMGGVSTLATQGSSAGNYPSTNPVINLFDGNLTSEFSSYGNSTSNDTVAGVYTGFYVTVSQCQPVLIGFRFACANDTRQGDPLTISIEGTNCDTLSTCANWTSLYNGSSGLDLRVASATYGEYQPVSNTAIYSSYRFLVTSKRGASNLVSYSEVQLFGYTNYTGTPANGSANSSVLLTLKPGSLEALWASVVGGTSSLATEAASGTGTYVTGQGVDKIFDKDFNTSYSSRGDYNDTGSDSNAGLNTGFFFTITRCQTTLSKFRIAPGVIASADPYYVILEGTNCVSALNCSSWTPLYAGTAGIGSISNRSSFGNFVYIASPKAYPGYRFTVVTKRSSSPYASYSEVELYGY
ncbi:unnamed protein product [Adineta ricciae]|uniref:Uncharacterized protein n=1 Tax=Adineta ricciae TaxID=249248 RepID=A0A814RQA5_ADIRI|nr:unnamed protein product [Adineta ricciae]CAF1337562.1 unnamed protein product [Adineta ricciae]